MVGTIVHTPWEWTSEDKQYKLIFTPQQNGLVKTDLYQRLHGGNFGKKPIAQIDESDIRIEERNFQEILRGLPQRIHAMNQLDHTTKYNVLQSVSSRRIIIERANASKFILNILALS